MDYNHFEERANKNSHQVKILQECVGYSTTRSIFLGRTVCPTFLHSVHGSNSFLNLMLLAVLSESRFMRSVISVVYSIALIRSGDVFVYRLLFSSL